MAKNMSPRDFLRDDKGVVSLEYLLFVAAIAIFLTVGVIALMGAMSDYFNSWATFFSST